VVSAGRIVLHWFISITLSGVAHIYSLKAIATDSYSFCLGDILCVSAIM